MSHFLSGIFAELIPDGRIPASSFIGRQFLNWLNVAKGLVLVGVGWGLIDAFLASAAQSEWVYYDATGKLVYKTWGNGNRIMDFSHAGYMGGGVALPDVPAVITIYPTGGDDRAVIQNAIQWIATRPLINGFRGALQLAPGVFLVSGQIDVTASGIVVRGAGSGEGGTTVRMTSPAPMTLFNIAGSGSPSESGTVDIIDTYVPSGAVSFHVSSTAGFRVGDMVIVRRPVTTNWIAYLGMDQLVRDGVTQTWLNAGTWITTDRSIKAIQGNEITLDVPLTDSFDATYLGYPVGRVARYTWPERISQVGIEHLRIEAPPVADPYVALKMDKVIDSWVRDVIIQDGVNCVTLTKNTKRVTLERVIVTHTVPSTAAAAPADFSVTGTQILLNRCEAHGTGSWPFVTQSTGTGPIVVLNFFSTQRAGISPHQRWTTGVLADNCYLPSAPSTAQGIAYRNRGTMGSGQGWTTAWSVAWNVTTPYFLVSAAPGTENWCIGGIGTKTSRAAYGDPDGIYDSLGMHVTLGLTHSLYLEQLRQRLGDQALINIGYATFVMSITPSSRVVFPGESAAFTVTVLGLNNFTNTLTFSVAGLPTNCGAWFVPPYVSGTGTCTLVVTTSNLAPYGTHEFFVCAEAPGLALSNLARLTLGDFGITTTPSTEVVCKGCEAHYTITLTTNELFTGCVGFDVEGLPEGAAARFEPPILCSNGISVLSIAVPTWATAGNYLVSVRATGGAANGTVVTNVVLSVISDNALPGTVLWSGTNRWSSAVNWTNLTAGGCGVPGRSNDVVFGNLGVATDSNVFNSFVDAEFTINSLLFTNTAGFQNLLLCPACCLSVVGTIPGFQNSPVLNVGMDTYGGSTDQVRVRISGTNSTVCITNTGGVIQVRQGYSSGMASCQASLDLSGLGTFQANVNRLQIGVESGAPRRVAGTLQLARTNFITLYQLMNATPDTLTSGNPALYLGHNTQVGNPLGASLLLGIHNAINVNYVVVGRGNQTNNLLCFNPIFLQFRPYARFRASDGVGRVGLWTVGDNSAGSLPVLSSGTNDFSGGTLDALVDKLFLGRGRHGTTTNTGLGVLTFDHGVLDVNLIRIGTMVDEPSSTNAAGIGIANVNGDAVLIVNHTLELAHTNVTAPAAPWAVTNTVGILNINGGTVLATNVVGAGGTSILNLNAGLLDLQPEWAPSPGCVVELTTAKLGTYGSAAPAVLANASYLSCKSPLTLQSNAVLRGQTHVSAPGLTVHGTVEPGRIVGTMSIAGTLTLAPGGRLICQITDFSGLPGLGWDSVSCKGTVAVTATAEAPFTIRLESVNTEGEVTPAAGFSNDGSAQWPILAAQSIIGFDPAKFRLETANFKNDLAGGYFYLATNMGGLILAFTNNHPPVANPAYYYAEGSGLVIPIAELATNWSDPDGDLVQLLGINTNSASGQGNVSTDGVVIHYSRCTTGPDSIFYTVCDVRTNPPAAYRPGDTIRTASGIIHILSAPAFTDVRWDGSVLTLCGRGGKPAQSYRVLTTTNLALPITQWTPIATNVFDPYGNFSFAVTEVRQKLQQFYLLETQ